MTDARKGSHNPGVHQPGAHQAGAWLNDDNVALLTDLYELTMVEAYVERGMLDTAVFDCFARRAPEARNYLLAAGLEDVLHYLENLHFTGEAIDQLRRTHPFSDKTLDYLRNLRFEGDVWAVPEGTPVFGNEPIISVEAPLPVAQLAETFILNQIHFQTLIASKASRIVRAAEGRNVVDFGLRRMHGADAGMKAARAAYIAGLNATSNVLAGSAYDIPVSGTMAHSYIQSYDSELDAFRDFARTWPETVLLVDTYDTLEGVRNVVRLAEQLGDEFKIKAVRLDSGDLADLARKSREILDDAGLTDVGIFVSGGLDEHKIADLVATAPVDGFGVGSKLGVSADAPYLDSAYKLVHYADKPSMKLSESKTTLPGRKQIYRIEGDDPHDIIATRDEKHEGRPLLELVMQGGARTDAGKRTLEDARTRARDELKRLPPRLRELENADPAYEVRTSEAMDALTQSTADAIENGERRGIGA